MKNNRSTAYPYIATASDAVFTTKIDAWQPLERGFLAAFGRDGFLTLNESGREFSMENRKIAFLTFENRYAMLGGLAAVMRLLPTSLQKFGEDTLLLTPLYVDIPKVSEAVLSGALSPVFVMEKYNLPLPPSSVGCDNESDESDNGAIATGQTLTISCYRDADAPIASYYIGIEGRFTADSNPYSYADSGDILDDSLAFCAAVPFVLSRLGITKDILFHAQDWETASIAVTSKNAVLDGLLLSARSVLTLHNSFDSGISASKKRMFLGSGVHGDTILQCAIPLLDGPLTTVSVPFARELCDDAMQRTVFTNHLQGVFSENPPIGIENGMFGRPYLRYTYSALSRARQGDTAALLKQKARFRDKMLETVESINGRRGVVGGLNLGGGEIKSGGSSDVGYLKLGPCGSKSALSAASDNAEKPKIVDDGRPIFFMSGRLDLMQKGFDVIFQAIKNFPAGSIGLIFCPSSADGVRQSKDLAFFREIAEERRGDVVIWPFRITAEEYVSVLLGSSFLLMPSLYEPFGAATEGFMHGTPVIARATGGLLVQVRDELRESDTGFLYRERGGAATERERECCEWREILDAPVSERVNIPLYRSMVSEAFAALCRASGVFKNERAYGRMMLNGMDGLRDFSWDIAVWKYRRVYDAVAKRGFFDE